MENQRMKTQSIFGWDYFFVYLSGPVDFADDSRGWRDMVTNRLVEIGFKRSQILDPCRKPALGIPFAQEEEWEKLRQYRRDKDYDALCDLESQIAHLDLHLVDKSSLLIVYFPKIEGTFFDKDNMPARLPQLPTYGTIHEVVEARHQKKTVFVVWEGGKQECSSWIMWLVKHQNVFGSFEEMFQHLCDIRDGKCNNANEWLLVNPES
jgi:hypothetical protein